MAQHTVTLDPQCGGVILSDSRGQSAALHPLWLRERVTDPESFDALNRQRLYEPDELPQSLKVSTVELDSSEAIKLRFSDQHVADLPLSKIRQELGWEQNPESPPKPKSWTTELKRPDTLWADLDDPNVMKAMLHDFLTYGFCIMQDTPTERDILLKLAGRFGYVRDTNFGMLFNVQKKSVATDIAYTDKALGAHTDNPYREPVPGLQFLHCLENEVAGGLSTLVDGIAIAARLAEESPEQAKVLEETTVRYIYDSGATTLVNYGPMIQRDHHGIVRRIRMSSRVDYVPPLDPKTLDLFYAGRRRLHELGNSEEFQISFPFKKGTLLMMDNYRLLHGRTAFDSGQGNRHLQGCYTDHDGVSSLYRQLARGATHTRVLRDGEDDA